MEASDLERAARKAAKKAARLALAASGGGAAELDASALLPAKAAGSKRPRAEEEEEEGEGGDARAASSKRGGVSSAGPASDEDGGAAAAAEPLSAAAFLALHKLSVRGGPPGFVMPAPLQRFADAPFAAPLQRALVAAGYERPTTTQAISWPAALAGHNLVSVARTGSGKTLGFLLPILHALHGAGAGAGAGGAAAAPAPKPLYTFAKPGSGAGGGGGGAGPRVLVMAPTRELACQTEVEATKFGRAIGLRACCVYGGAAKGPQIQGVRVSDIVVGTPGRLQVRVRSRTAPPRARPAPAACSPPLCPAPLLRSAGPARHGRAVLRQRQVPRAGRGGPHA